MQSSTQTDQAPETPEPTEEPTEALVQITKQALEIDLADMAAQLSRLVQDTAKVQGAIIYCTRLIAVMEGKAPMTEPRIEMPTQEEVEQMRADAKAADTAAREAQKPKRKSRAKPKPPAKDATSG